GAPATLANRFRLAAGLPPVSEKPDFRWLRVLLAGSFALFVVFALSVFFLVKSFLPVFEQDPKTGVLRILGGWVEVDPKRGEVTVGKGRYRLDPGQMRMNLSV